MFTMTLGVVKAEDRTSALFRPSSSWAASRAATTCSMAAPGAASSCAADEPPLLDVPSPPANALRSTSGMGHGTTSVGQLPWCVTAHCTVPIVRGVCYRCLCLLGDRFQARSAPSSASRKKKASPVRPRCIMNGISSPVCLDTCHVVERSLRAVRLFVRAQARHEKAHR